MAASATKKKEIDFIWGSLTIKTVSVEFESKVPKEVTCHFKLGSKEKRTSTVVSSASKTLTWPESEPIVNLPTKQLLPQLEITVFKKSLLKEKAVGTIVSGVFFPHLISKEKKVQKKNTRKSPFTITFILLCEPAPHFDQFCNLFFTNNNKFIFVLLHSVREARESEAGELMRNIISVTMATKKTLPVLQQILTDEITKISSQALLFREDSAGVQFIKEFLMVEGLPFVKQVHTAVNISLFVFQDKFNEHPTTPSEKKTLVTRLSHLLEQLFQSLKNSLPYLSSNINEFFQLLSSKSEEKFPQSSTAAINSIFFLRFICPSLTTRALLAASSKEHQRVYSFLTKLLQRIANNSWYPAGHDLEDLNPLIEKSSKMTQDFYFLLLKSTEDKKKDAVTQEDKVVESYKALIDYVQRKRDHIHSELDYMLEKKRISAEDSEQVKLNLPSFLMETQHLYGVDDDPQTRESKESAKNCASCNQPLSNSSHTCNKEAGTSSVSPVLSSEQSEGSEASNPGRFLNAAAEDASSPGVTPRDKNGKSPITRRDRKPSKNNVSDESVSKEVQPPSSPTLISSSTSATVVPHREDSGKESKEKKSKKEKDKKEKEKEKGKRGFSSLFSKSKKASDGPVGEKKEESGEESNEEEEEEKSS